MAQRSPGLGPAFTNIFTANLASSLGDGVARVATPLLGARLTDDPLLVAGLTAFALLPWLFFAIPAGILVDRIDRRRALALANGVRTLVALLLVALVATDSLTIWWLYAIIFVYGAFETVYDGAIRAVIPSIVARPRLPAANSRIEGAELVVQNFLSGPFTSVLFAVTALIPLGVNAAVFAVALGLAFALPKAASGLQFASDDGEPAVVWYRQLADGLRFILNNRMLRTLWFVSTIGGLLSSAATASWVLFVLDRLGLPEALFGVFMLSGAVGGILGSVIASRLKQWWGTGLAMSVMNVLIGVSLVAVGAIPTIAVAAIGFGVFSGAVTVWNILVVSLRQSVIPGRLLGRVHGTWRTLLWGTMPLGAVIGGLLGRIDLTVPLLVGGGLSTVVAVVFFRFTMSLPNPEDVDNGDPRLDDDPAT